MKSSNADSRFTHLSPLQRAQLTQLETLNHYTLTKNIPFAAIRKLVEYHDEARDAVKEVADWLDEIKESKAA
jgi:hypothetical protein